MNVADSEVVASIMKMAGYDTCESIDDADAVFINTCSVRDNAEQKVINRLEAVNAMRHGGRRPIIGVLGCMAERVKQDLIDNHHADLVAGPDAYLTLPDLMAQAETGHKAINTELSTTETYRDIVPSRICGPRVAAPVTTTRRLHDVARAAAALHYLTTQGIKPTTLRGICYGDTRPYKPGIDEASRAANRRVEFVFHRPEVMNYSVVY